MIRKIWFSGLLVLALPIGAWAAPSLNEQLGAPSLHEQLQRQQREMDLPIDGTTSLPSIHEQLGAPSLQEQLRRQQQDQYRVQHQLPEEH
jgi:hypothetical protein